MPRIVSVVVFVGWASCFVAACGDGTANFGADVGGVLSELPGVDIPNTASDTPDGAAELPELGPDPFLPLNWSDTPVGFRSADDVCAAFGEAGLGRVDPHHTPGTGTCEPSTLTSDARREAMLRLNFYRWLAGVPFTRESSDVLADIQLCAFYMDVNETGLTHDPPRDLACYVDSVTDFAGRSILAQGTANPGDSVELFMSEAAHRALSLAPGLAYTAMGHHGETTCQLVFGERWNWTPETHRTVAYPAPGPNPQAPTRVFTFLPASGHTYDDSTSVAVSLEGAAVALSVSRPTTGYGDVFLVAELESEPDVGVSYDVEITGIATDAGRTEERFPVSFVTCP